MSAIGMSYWLFVKGSVIRELRELRGVWSGSVVRELRLI